MFSIQKLSIMTYAKVAGLLYLLIAIAGGFSIGYVPTVISVPGDAVATAAALSSNGWLLKLGIVADIFVLLCEVVLTVMLYHLFKHVSKTLALVATFARFAMSIIMSLNLVNLLVPLLLLSGAAYLQVFSEVQLQSLSLLFLEIHQYGIYIWGMFFGLHLAALGYLIINSGYFPKFLGYCMAIGSLGYAGEAVVKFTIPDNEVVGFGIGVLLVIAVIGELGFTFWLLIKGIDAKTWEEFALKTNK